MLGSRKLMRCCKQCADARRRARCNSGGVHGRGLHVEDNRGKYWVVARVARARVDESGGSVGVGAVTLVDVSENVVCWLDSLLSVEDPGHKDEHYCCLTSIT